MKKPPKPKQIAFSLIPPMDNGHEPEAYRVMREAREKWHQDLEGAKIALAWRKRLKADKDGHLMLGKCMKATDLQRELVNWDFVILLNKEVFQDPAFTPDKRLALIDHELCHATRVHDKYGLPASDEYGRSVWRTRKHDIEEFICIIDRHGCYKKDLEKCAEVLVRDRGNLPLPGMTDTVAKISIPIETSTDDRVRTRKRLRTQSPIPPRKPTDPPPGVQP
jgi:Putative phage metallopeptidase